MSSRASSVVSSIRNTRRVSWIAQCTGVGVLRHEQTHMVNSHNNIHNTSTNTNAYVCIYIYILCIDNTYKNDKSSLSRVPVVRVVAAALTRRRP